jgi:hypothetical protein
MPQPTAHFFNKILPKMQMAAKKTWRGRGGAVQSCAGSARRDKESCLEGRVTVRGSYD